MIYIDFFFISIFFKILSLYNYEFHPWQYSHKINSHIVLSKWTGLEKKKKKKKKRTKWIWVTDCYKLHACKKTSFPHFYCPCLVLCIGVFVFFSLNVYLPPTPHPFRNLSFFFRLVFPATALPDFFFLSFLTEP